jgi:hypothetical protein
VRKKSHKIVWLILTLSRMLNRRAPFSLPQVERLLAAQCEKLAAEWRAGQEQGQQEGALRDAQLRKLQMQQDNTQKAADQLKVSPRDGGATRGRTSLACFSC